MRNGRRKQDAAPFHQDCLSGHVTCVSELPTEGMNGKHLPTGSHPSMATGDLAGICCWPFLGWAASGGALDDGVRMHVLSKQKDRGAWRIPRNVCGCACAKVVKVYLELVTAGAAGTKGEAQRTLMSIQKGSVWSPNLSSFQCGQVSVVRKAEAAQSFCYEPVAFLANHMA